MANELIWLDRATAAIAKVSTLGEAKAIEDRAAALKLWAAKQGWSQEQKAKIAEIEIRAARRVGELLPPKEETNGRPIPGGNSFPPAKQRLRARRVASLPVEEFEAYIARNKEDGEKLSVTGVARLAKEQDREQKRCQDRAAVKESKAPEMLEGVFATIVVDPPWDFGDEGDVDQFGRGKPDYATMTIEQIAAVPVGDRAAKDAHLYLWITNRSLPKGFALLDQWGFRYVTCLTWCKPSIGMGNYFRGSTEQILFGVRGSLPLNRKNLGTWFAAPRPKKQHRLSLETWSVLPENRRPGKVGWTLDEAKMTDYTLHVFDHRDTKEVFFIAFQLLRMAFRSNLKLWENTIGYRRPQNSGTWKSQCLFVPAFKVLAAISAEMRPRL
jgi:hypothetical protein